MLPNPESLELEKHIAEGCSTPQKQRGLQVSPHTMLLTCIRFGAKTDICPDQPHQSMKIHSSISPKIARTKAEKQRSEFFRTAVALMSENKHALVFEETAKVLQSSPNDAEMWNLLGVAATVSQGRASAEVAFQRAVALNPRYREAWMNYANVTANQHKLDEALAAYRQILALKPTPDIHSTILFLQQKLERDPEALYAAHLEYGRIYGGRKAKPFKNDPDPNRKLRIGYVSGDFREHSVAFFIEPILAHHDHEQVEVHAFSNGAPDYVTARLKPHFDHWHDVRKLDDLALFRLIRDRRIDVLVDLAGHTNLNRLPVFGMRAAPVQASWFGYMATTGLVEMDYRLTDRHTCTAAHQRYYTEQLYPLGGAVVWNPAPEAPPVAPPPYLKNGHITFASLNNFAKVTPDVLATWAELLRAVPDAVLVIVAIGASTKTFQEPVRRVFASVSAEERLVFVEQQPLDKFLGLFEHFDIALDPFPYNGGTTTLHTLWAGVPLVTLAGTSEIERSGQGCLNVVGLARELTARSPEQYVQIAADLARNPQKLVEWRNTMRDKLVASPLMAFETRARNLEAAYRDMFQRYCAQAQHANT